MGIRETFRDAILGQERLRMQESIAILEDAYKRGPYVITPDHLALKLKETDSSQLLDLVRRLEGEYQIISGMTVGDEAARRRAIEESRLLWAWDVVTQWIVWLWTNYGFGTTISVAPTDENLQDAWKTFWDADENANLLADDNIAMLSERLLVDGEFYLVFFISVLDGSVTVRMVRTDEITEIVTEPEDEMTPIYYKREMKKNDDSGETATVYYPDYLAHINGYTADAELPEDAIRAEGVNSETDVVMMHVAYNRKTGIRGWPIYTAGSVWTRAHTRFREDRASVAASVAMYVNKIKASSSGQKAVDALKTKLGSSLMTSGYGQDSNPPAPAGSTLALNTAVDYERMGQVTGAGDAKLDGESLLLMAGLGGGVFPHYLGAGDSYKLATATAMERPTFRQWSRYQNFWGAKFRRMVRIVAWADSQYGSFRDHEDVTADINTDRLIEDDLAQISTALSNILRDGLQPYLNLLPDEMALEIIRVVWTNILEALGVEDVGDVLKDEWFKVAKKEEEPEAREEVPDEEPEDEPGEVPPTAEEVEIAGALVGVMKGWDARLDMIEGTLRESHEPIEVMRVCREGDCDGQIAYRYPDHPMSLVVCATCGKTFNVDLE